MLALNHSRSIISIANYKSARAEAHYYSSHVRLFANSFVASCSVHVSTRKKKEKLSLLKWWLWCYYKQRYMLHGQITIIGPKQQSIWREDKVHVGLEVQSSLNVATTPLALLVIRLAELLKPLLSQLLCSFRNVCYLQQCVHSFHCWGKIFTR